MIGRRIISYLHDPLDVLPLSEAKNHLDIIRTDQDALIESYVSAAIDYASQVVGFSIRPATVDYYYDWNEHLNPYNTDFRKSRYGLRIPANVISLTGVYYRNSDGGETTIDTADYDFANFGEHIPLVKFINVPGSHYNSGWSYKVRVTEGYYALTSGSTSDAINMLPPNVKMGIMLILRDLYDFRGNQVMGQSYTVSKTAEYYLYPFSKLQIL